MRRIIDADELKEKIEIDNFDSPMMNPVMTMTKVLEYIDEAPTIEPEKPYGKWIYGTGLEYRVMCSYCGNIEILNSKNFCPNCGADMRKEGEQK